MSLVIFFGTMAIAVALFVLFIKYGHIILPNLSPVISTVMIVLIMYYGAMWLPMQLSRNYTKQKYVAEISELDDFSAEHMYAAMTTKPQGEGILSCGYIDKWSAFAIRFDANSNRFYVYMDFPKAIYTQMLNSDDPYSYYLYNIRGQYGEAERYPLPKVDIFRGTIEY